jgi:thiol:disulfide interchange protein
MLKKLFDWTPRDVADWEKIRSKGLLRFVLGYGLVLFGGIMFIVLGATATLIRWNRAQAASLISELVIIAVICLSGGLVNSLVTWAVEEKLYQKYKEIHNPENRPE